MSARGRRLLPRPSWDIRSIAVDFDGCLVSDAWPEIGEPNERLIKELAEHAASGCKIVLWTCRHDEKLAEAVSAAKAFGIEFDAINENPFSGYEDLGETRKIYADLYVDDKALKVRAK